MLCSGLFCTDNAVFQSVFAEAKSFATARRSANCGCDSLFDCSCLLGMLHLRALFIGVRFTQAGTLTGVFWMKQKEAPKQCSFCGTRWPRGRAGRFRAGSSWRARESKQDPVSKEPVEWWMFELDIPEKTEECQAHFDSRVLEHTK